LVACDSALAEPCAVAALDNDSLFTAR